MHARRTQVLGGLLLALGGAGCRGKLVASAALTGPGTAEASFVASGKPLRLWADTDGEWKGGKSAKLNVTYDVVVLRSGQELTRITCTTEDVRSTVCGVHKHVDGVHDADCELQLGCALPSLTPGDVQLRVTATTGPNVTLARKLSLNVRED